VPEEFAPVQVIGRMTLNANPTNYFAETEQVAFCTAQVPRGIDFTDDPLLQARNFSYLDTQLTRLGGPNFNQLPINRPHSPVNTTQRDGFAQQAVAEGVAAYTPNSVGAGCPFPAGNAGYVSVPRTVSGRRVRVRASSFSDHFSQAAMYWASMSTPEQDHIVGAFSFELGKCLDEGVKDRMLGNLANVSSELAECVAASLGKKAPRGRPVPEPIVSEALSLVPIESGPVIGRNVGVYAADGVDGVALKALTKALQSAGVVTTIIAPHGGTISSDGGSVVVNKSALVTQSVEYDALVVAGGDGADTYVDDPYCAMNLAEAYRHYKPIAAWGAGRSVLDAFGISADLPGVVTAASTSRTFVSSLIEAIGWHRYWERDDVDAER
jgi:catalase